MARYTLSAHDRAFLTHLRGLAILGIVFNHVGGGWVFKPYSEFIGATVPVFFFLSGAVSYSSYHRSPTASYYVKKRVVALLVPYYMLCILSLAVYLVARGKFPAFSLKHFALWFTMSAPSDLMPFPSGQVWFLHTLLIIMLVSPVFFELFDRRPLVLLVALALPIALCTTQLFTDIHSHFMFAGNNLYKPISNSIFFVLGFACLSPGLLRRRAVLFCLIVGCMLAAVALVQLLHLDVCYTSHAYSPDLYYVFVGVAAIAGVCIARPAFVATCDGGPPVAGLLRFMHRYTFPVFLLHSFAIYLAEELLGLVHPERHYIVYGIAKFSVVLVATCILAVPFGWMSERVIGTIGKAIGISSRVVRKGESATGESRIDVRPLY